MSERFIFTDTDELFYLLLVPFDDMWNSVPRHEKLDKVTCLAQIKLESEFNPLYANRGFNQGRGLLAVKPDRWQKVWTEVLKFQEVPFIYDIKKQLEFQIRYVSYLWSKYEDYEWVYRAFAVSEDMVDALIAQGCNLMREESILSNVITYMTQRYGYYKANQSHEVTTNLVNYTALLNVKKIYVNAFFEKKLPNLHQKMEEVYKIMQENIHLCPKV